jgi:phenylalanyl-tRNA synthetase beta chain
MKISYNWLQSFFDKKLPARALLAEVLTLHSFEVESVEKNGKDYILECAILPNRAHDLLAHRGIAREVAALTGLKIKESEKILNFESKILNSGGKAPFMVQVLEKKLCRRYIGLAISGVKVGPSPKWLTERLESVGQKSINNIVDATNFVMLELGQPLHAFDAEKLADKKIVVRKAQDGENIITLDGVAVALNKDDLVIADGSEPLAIAGIKGGKKAEIDSGTKNIILESANFDAVNIRRTSRRVNIATDSSARFVAGLHPDLAQEAMTKVATLILEIAGGKVVGSAVDIYSGKLKAPKIILNPEKVSSILGVKIPEKEIKKILVSVGCSVRGGGEKLLVTPPVLRLDLELTEDLIEEVGRIYGYDRIVAKPPLVPAAWTAHNETVMARDTIKDLLKGMGFMEVYNYSFIGEKEAEFMGMNNLPAVARLANPTRPELSVLRPTLIPGFAANLQSNMKHAEELYHFEIGNVFFGDKEKESFGLGILSEHMKGKEAFYRLKGFMSSILDHLGVSDYWFDEVLASDELARGAVAYLHPFQVAQVKIGDENIGVIGSLHPEFMKMEKLRGGAAVAEMDFAKLVALSAGERGYQAISKYPSITRDIAIIIPQETRMTAVADVIENIGGELLFDANLFDVYDGAELGENKSSLAFHLIFQSAERTLKDSEIDAIMERIISALEDQTDWEVRK